MQSLLAADRAGKRCTDRSRTVEVEATYRRQAIFSSPKFMILLTRLVSSIQSIMGATDILRSSFFRENSAEMPIFVGFSDSGVSGLFLGIPGSLRVAEAT